MTRRIEVSTVVNRREHCGHSRRRLMAWPSSLIRVSTTLVSGFWQKGQCICNIIAPKDRKTHVYRAYQHTTLDILLEFR